MALDLLQCVAVGGKLIEIVDVGLTYCSQCFYKFRLRTCRRDYFSDLIDKLEIFLWYDNFYEIAL